VRRGNLLILLLAIVMGSVAAYLARNWIEAHATVTPAVPVGTIVVAAAPLGFGTVLSRENLTEISWAAAKLPEGAFATRDQLLKDGRRVVLTPMQRSEPIMNNKVTGPGQRASLSALLDEGKRAVTVRVDDVRGVAGFVLPGDRVDVVLIRSVTRPTGPSENVSDVLLQHVKVLAVDQLVSERQEKPTIAKAVTLEVETDQAQKILLASNIGKLSLILRQAGENNPALAKRVTESDLGIADVRNIETTGPAASAPMIRSRTSSVEVVRGMKMEKYDVVRTDE
jgi:pilus assembly protein CpaB